MEDHIPEKEEIVPADEGLRKKLVVFLVVVVFLAGAGVFFLSGPFQEEIERLGKANPHQAVEKLRQWLRVAQVANVLVTVVAAAYFIRLGFRILGEGRFPPSGMRVIRPTKVRYGKSARLAAVGQFCIAVLVACTNLIFYQLQRLLDTLVQP